MDRSRQHGRSLGDISSHHVYRYRLASRYASGRVLDAACGIGYGTKMLSEGRVAVGVDCSPQAIAWAEEYYAGPEYIVGRIEAEPWAGRFDTVVSLETLEHLHDPLVALRAFREACDGILIASVPNEELYPFKAEVFAKDEFPHFRHYTPKEFQELLEDGGFRVVERFCQVSKSQPEMASGTDGRFLTFICE